MLEDRCLPSTFTVLNLNDSGTGSLRDQVALANSTPGPNTIQFAPGLTGTISLGSTIAITNAVTIDGPGASVISVSGNDAVQLFTVSASAGAVTFQGLTLTRGSSAAQGGAIFDQGSSLTLASMTFSDNYAGSDGGGVNVLFGNLTIQDSTFARNTAGHVGGGVFDVFQGSDQLSNVTFNDNSAGKDGGGLYLYDVSLTLQNGTFTDNIATNDGGGAYLSADAGVALITTVSSSSFDHNQAVNGNGGGLRTLGATNLNGAEFSDDKSGFDGGALYVADGSLTVQGGSLSRNDATEDGGALFVHVDPGLSATSTVTGGSFTSNRADNGDGGGLHVEGPLTLTNTTIGGNRANAGNGGGVYAAATLTVAAGTIITNNTAGLAGGGFYAVSAPPIDPNAQVIANVASRGNPDMFRGTPLARMYFAVGADAGGGPLVTVYSTGTGAVVGSFYAFAPAFTGGVRVAVADLNGDGTPDIIVGTGPGGAPDVIVVDGTKLNQLQPNGQIASSALLGSFFAFPPTFTGGVTVAAAVASFFPPEIVVGAGAGGGPAVIVVDASKLNQLQPNGQIAQSAVLGFFYALPVAFTGGVTVGVGDVNADDFPDIAVGSGAGGGPFVAVVDGKKLSQIPSNGQLPSSDLLGSFFAFDPAFTGGVNVTVSDVNGDGIGDVVVGAGAGGGPEVIVIDGRRLNQLQPNNQIADSALLAGFFAFSSDFTGGVRVAVTSAFGSNGRPVILTAEGPGGSPQVNVYDGLSSQLVDTFFAVNPNFTGGLYIADC